jgi:hypothetical protein
MDIEYPPLADLVAVNLSHYRTTADLEHGLHFTGLPTPYVSGHAFEAGEKFALGSTEIRAFPNPQAKVAFLEFTGAGLSHLSERLAVKEAMMATLGSRILSSDKRQVEAAETAAIHRASENSVLASLAQSASSVVTRAMEWCAMWAGIQAMPSLVLNTDYLPSGMTSQDVTALVSAWQSGAISKATLYDNLQRGEIARQGVTYEDEEQQLMIEGPSLADIDTADGNGQ